MTDEERSVFEESSDLLIEQRKIHREMAGVGTAAHKEFNINSKHISALKDYVHYYGNDWVNGNPLIAEKDVKWRCRLAPVFRRLVKVVDDLRYTGKLDLLEPIIKALEDVGIHLSIDDDIKFDRVNELMAYITAMDDYQTSICELADERTGNRDDAVNSDIATTKSFNEYVRLMANYKSSKDKIKTRENINEDVQDLLLGIGIESHVYNSLKDEVNE